MKVTRKHFTIEEKANAVKSILSGSKSRADIRIELGVKKTGTITIWINDYINNRKKYVIKDENTFKVCPKCGRNLLLSEYWANNATSDGLQSYCKDCLMSYNKTDKIESDNQIEKSIKDDIYYLYGVYGELLTKIKKIEKTIG